MKAAGKDRLALRIFAIAGLLMISAGLGLMMSARSQPCGGVVNPGCLTGARLVSEGSWLNSPTSLTMEIRNIGRQSTSLSSYYVQDSNGHLYSAPTWVGPTIPVNTPANVTFTIDGKDFAFYQNYSYTISVHSSVGGVFSFTVYA